MDWIGLDRSGVELSFPSLYITNYLLLIAHYPLFSFLECCLNTLNRQSETGDEETRKRGYSLT
jgi:hypothetical protein